MNKYWTWTSLRRQKDEPGKMVTKSILHFHLYIKSIRWKFCIKENLELMMERGFRSGMPHGLTCYLD